MIKACFEKQPKATGGGYGKWEGDTLCIFIDPRDNPQKQLLTALHEVLDGHLNGQVRHWRLDQIAIDQIDCLQQLGLAR